MSLNLTDANSTEIDADTKHPVISLLSEQRERPRYGRDHAPWNYTCRLKPNSSKAYQAYGKDAIRERHRHRYEFNNKYQEHMEQSGFIISGTLENGMLCEIAEIQDHPWMLGVQFHPEFKSKPTDPHPLFRDFVQKAIAHKEKKDD